MKFLHLFFVPYSVMPFCASYNVFKVYLVMLGLMGLTEWMEILALLETLDQLVLLVSLDSQATQVRNFLCLAQEDLFIRLKTFLFNKALAFIRNCFSLNFNCHYLH